MATNLSANAPVFMILAHADPAMFRRLANRLRSVGFLIAHIDLKAKQGDFEHPNVVFTQKRHDVRWAGFSMVAATLEMLRLGSSRFPFASHFVLLSGADYPIASDARIRNYFSDNIGHNHICFINVRESSDHYRRMVTRYSFRDLGGTRGELWIKKAVRKAAETALIPFAKRFPSSLIPCFGSSWWSISGDCARYILKRIEEEPFWLSYWRYIASPDEQFFHTLVANSSFLNSADGFKSFEGRGLWRLANLHHVHPSLDKVYMEEDWAEISSSKKLFIRKVHSSLSGNLLKKIDEISRD